MTLLYCIRMTDTNLRIPDLVFPALLRHARTTYGFAMRKALEEAGYDDIPRNGLYIIGGLAMGAEDIPLSRLIKELRISKQAAGQLVDTLVNRGYLERKTDSDDRRKLTIGLTERGKAAAATQAAVRERIDAELIRRVGQENVDRTRHTLGILIDMGFPAELESED